VVREGLILLSHILRRRNSLKDMRSCTSQRFVHVNAPNLHAFRQVGNAEQQVKRVKEGNYARNWKLRIDKNKQRIYR
jgi:hypothetical protein